jgi:farnesyl-diphosphate farnesyltransferase
LSENAGRTADLPLRAILKRVSRSFYLSLRLLPRQTRETVALAYLLARAADTVADTRLVAPADRVRLLAALDALFQGEARSVSGLADLARSDDMTPAEKELLVELPACVATLEGLPELDQELTREVLGVITGGMRDDLMRFPGEDASALRALDTTDELMRYCYQVAGCVGAFWSDLHAERLPALRRIDRVAWSGLGVRLGRTLQLTNVLRDVRRDLSHGRCYLPRTELARVGLEPVDLLDAGSWPALRPVVEDLVAQAVGDALAGLRHTLWIPPRLVSLRLAGFLPLLLALLTLGLVLRHNPLEETSLRKVSRRTVYRVLASAFMAARQDRALIALFRATVREAGLERYLDCVGTPK